MPVPSANRVFMRLLAGLGLCFFSLRLLAATPDDWLVRPWQNDDGLPDNSVNGVAQTADGYLWVGTPTGLARFDGLRFEGFSLTNVVAPPNRGVVTMMRGAKGSLWLAMDRGGVVKLDGTRSRAFTDDLPKLIPNGLAEDAAGGIWIAYRGGKVFYIKNT
ncbi:MAG TPA: two-component regulator propeller domain-containing protein, partial [Verrucomicrobiae bacterium]